MPLPLDVQYFPNISMQESFHLSYPDLQQKIMEICEYKYSKGYWNSFNLNLYSLSSLIVFLQPKEMSKLEMFSSFLPIVSTRLPLSNQIPKDGLFFGLLQKQKRIFQILMKLWMQLVSSLFFLLFFSIVCSKHYFFFQFVFRKDLNLEVLDSGAHFSWVLFLIMDLTFRWDTHIRKNS